MSSITATIRAQLEIEIYLFFEVDWIEEKEGFTKGVYRAKDFNTMYRAIKHMNIEQQEMK